MEANHQSTSRVFETPDLGDEEDAALGRIEELRRQLRFYVAEPRRWVGVVARVLRAEAIRGSNSIEGFHVSVEDALAATEAAGADWNAVMGYRRAMTYVLQLADDEHFRFSPDLIRGLHFMITEYDLDARPGRWRGGPIWVRNDATGEVVYEGPEYELVPGLVDGLVLQLEADKGDAMVRGAMAHLNLAMIHPFRDGASSPLIRKLIVPCEPQSNRCLVRTARWRFDHSRSERRSSRAAANGRSVISILGLPVPPACGNNHLAGFGYENLADCRVLVQVPGPSGQSD